MSPLRLRTEVAAPAATVWQLIAEFENWAAWGPSVRAVESPTDVVAPGVRGRVQTPLRLWLPFEITAVEPGRSWSWTVAGIEATGHTITPLSEGRCRVEFSVPAWFAPYALAVRVGLRRLRKLAEAD